VLQPIIEETNYLTVASQSQLKDVVLEYKSQMMMKRMAQLPGL